MGSVHSNVSLEQRAQVDGERIRPNLISSYYNIKHLIAIDGHSSWLNYLLLKATTLLKIAPSQILLHVAHRCRIY